MAYENFIYAVWKKGIEKELEKKHVFVDGCTREYEGAIKKRGDKVRIKTLGNITIHKLARTAVNNDIADAEQLDDDALEIIVDQIAYFNVSISNIDAVQADENLFAEFSGKAAEGFADDEDKFVANFANDTSIATANNVLDAVAKLTPDNVLDVILNATQRLYENNVKETTYIEAIVPPAFKSVATKAKILTDTNNSATLKNGRVGQINNVYIKMSNNVAKSSDDTKYMIMVRTKDACAFVEQITKIIPYSPEKKLDTDALKGYVVYGGKVLRPKQIVVVPIAAFALSA